MNKGLGALVCAGVAVAAVLFVVALLLVKLLWAWTVPDLFPGAVEQGLVAGRISWLTAMKIALFIAVLAAFTRTRRVRKRSGNEIVELSI
jgi:hypothetical protein